MVNPVNPISIRGKIMPTTLLFAPSPRIFRPSYGPEPGADEASKEEDFVHKRLINHVNLIEKHTKKTLQLLIIRHRSNRTREQTQPRKTRKCQSIRYTILQLIEIDY